MVQEKRGGNQYSHLPCISCFCLTSGLTKTRTGLRVLGPNWAPEEPGGTSSEMASGVPAASISSYDLCFSMESSRICCDKESVTSRALPLDCLPSCLARSNHLKSKPQNQLVVPMLLSASQLLLFLINWCPPQKCFALGSTALKAVEGNDLV